MAEELSNLEQYKMLREEIMLHLREMYRTDFWALAAIGAVYSFLFNKAHARDLMWFIPPFFLFVAGVRVRMIFKRMQLIAQYLKQIEGRTGAVDRAFIGWQTYLLDKSGEKPAVSVAISIWAAVLALSLVGSVYFYIRGAGNDAPKSDCSHCIERAVCFVEPLKGEQKPRDV